MDRRVSDDGDRKALQINHQLNKHMLSQRKKAQRGSFRDKKQSLGKYWGYFSQFNPFRAEGVPGDFHQQKNEEIRLSQPAPFATKPPQTRLLRENGYPVKSEKQLRLKTS